MQLGMIGLGMMGGNTVRRWIARGRDCVVFDRTRLQFGGHVERAGGR
jgi:6-phosphogluconate dehydrogenase (decarboxylating)